MGIACYPDLPLLFFHQLLDDGQAEAASAHMGIAGRVTGVEAVKNPGQFLLGNPGPPVPHLHPNASLLFADAHADHAPFPAVPQGVADQVVQNPLRGIRVSQDEDRPLGDPDLRRQFRLRDLPIKGEHRLANPFAHIHRPQADLGVAGLQLGQIEEVIDQSGQSSGLFFDDLQIFLPLPIRQIGIPPEGLRIAEERSEGVRRSWETWVKRRFRSASR